MLKDYLHETVEFCVFVCVWVWVCGYVYNVMCTYDMYECTHACMHSSICTPSQPLCGLNYSMCILYSAFMLILNAL